MSVDPAAADVEAAHRAFYRALMMGDAQAMADLWSRAHPVTCVHPGTPNLVGYRAVVGSWSQILAHRGLEISASRLEVRVLGESALTTCIESLGEVELAVTNIYVREDGGWKIVHHHASPVSRRIATGPGVVH
ncbi:MAG: nuclear transport factor 2 family protein [Nannocystaceae bacterium]